MEWDILLYTEFETELLELSEAVRLEILALAELLVQFGPQLSRPHVDTLNGSKYSNMKELRFKCENGVWRVAFAFDPNRQGILLIAANKSGMSQKLFYKQLISKADKRYEKWLEESEV